MAFALLFVGCARKSNPYYCAGANPDNNCTEDAAGGAHFCTSNAQCSAPASICEIPSNTCVQCTVAQASACSGASPVCGAGGSCRGCTSHAECLGSNACLPDGSCATDDDVAYIAPWPEGTDNPACGMATPCTKVANALATGRRYLKLHGTTDEAVTIKDRDVTMLADPSATLTRTSNGNILIVDGASNVAIYDLAINGASGNGTGIWLPPGGSQSLTLTRVTMSENNGTGGAITASGGTLNLYQSTIADNTGAGAGISLTATSFDFENNIIVHNGDSLTSTFGGVLITQLGNGVHKLDFNTIAQNVSKLGSPSAGVTCQLIAQRILFGNNIVYGNSNKQVSGQNCAWTYSNIGPDNVVGTENGNMNADPMFVDPGNGTFHIMGGSPVIDKADPDATLAVDIDGDARPQGGRRDIGADEFTP